MGERTGLGVKRETHILLESCSPYRRAGFFMELLLLGSLDTDTVLGMLSESSGIRYSTRTVKRTLNHGDVMKTNTPSVVQRQSSAYRNQFNQEAALQLVPQEQVLQGHQETHLLLIQPELYMFRKLPEFKGKRQPAQCTKGL